MPLFDPATLATSLGVTNPSNEYSYLQGFVVYLENYLNLKGLEFGGDDVDGILQDFDDPTTIIPTKFVRPSDDIITIKNYSDSSYSKVLNKNVDYIVRKAKLAPNPVFEIKLLTEYVCLPKYIVINGKWSFADTIPADINNAVIDLLQVAVGNFRYNQKLMSNSGQSKTMTKIDTVEVRYGGGGSNRDTDYNSLLQSSLLFQVIQNYLYD